MPSDFRIRTMGEGEEGKPVWTPPPAGPAAHARIARSAAMQSQQRWKLWKTRAILGGAAVIFLSFCYIGWLYVTLPDISTPGAFLADQSSVVVDRNGVELYRLFGDEDRTFIENEKIPEHMRQAIVAIEDRRFYERGCIDVRAVARAVVRLGQGGGASTLTRQLARNALDLQRENILSRKLKEFFLGCSLEGRYTKDEILELYLNWVPFGRNAYGIEQASNAYFGKSSSGLTLAQAAVLASIPQRPSYFSPYGNHVYTDVTNQALDRILRGQLTSAEQLDEDDVLVGLIGARIGTGSTIIEVGGRTNQVLRNMRDMEFITEQEETAALAELKTMTFQPLRESIRAPHFVLWVRQLVDGLVGNGIDEEIIDRGGLRIETTLDWTLQQHAEDAVRRQADDILTRFGANNIALVALDPASRDILAYVGNANFEDEEHGGKVDMARAARQPGSTFKPFVYAAAFREGYNPATILYDVETAFGDDVPQNFDGTFTGLIDARHALAGSRNVPAIKAFYLVPGDDREDRILDLVTAMGAPTPQATKRELQASQAGQGIAADKRFSYGYPLAIGAAETPLVDMVQGYATLADGGQTKPVAAIRRILDQHGSIIYQAEEPHPVEALDPRVAYQVTSILSDTAARPNEYWRTVLSVPGWEAAGKTGTSNKCLERVESGPNKGQCKDRRPSDVWTLGYTPALVAGVWVGNADGSALSSSAESLITAAPIWKNFMVKAHAEIAERAGGAPRTFTQPSGIIFPQLSTLSGELPTECTPVERRRADVVLEEFAPGAEDPACAFLEVDRVTGLLASESCPIEARERGAYLVPTSVLADRWPLWQKGVNEWAAKQMERWNASPDHSGSLLPLPLAPTAACDIRLTPGRMTKPTVRINTPQAGGIVPYPAFRPDLTITSGSPVRETRFTIDGKLAATGSGSAQVTVRAPRSVSEEGTHILEVTVVDAYYNTVSAQVQFRFGQDDDAPTVRFVSPRDDTTVPSGATLNLRADAGDGDGGIKYVQFFLDSRLLTTKPTAPYTLDYPADIRPGEYTLRAVATDLASNEGEDVVRLTVTE